MDVATELAEPRLTVEAVYRADAERLWHAVLAWAGDPEIASDAVAEAYAQVIRRGDSVRDPAAWTWRAAFRIAAGAMKSRPSTIDTDRADLGVHVDRYADPDLLAALQRLPDGQRAAVVLFYLADLPIGQIANRLGSNSIAVRANLSRGRRRLRELLGDRDG